MEMGSRFQPTGILSYRPQVHSHWEKNAFPAQLAVDSVKATDHLIEQRAFVCSRVPFLACYSDPFFPFSHSVGCEQGGWRRKRRRWRRLRRWPRTPNSDLTMMTRATSAPKACTIAKPKPFSASQRDRMGLGEGREAGREGGRGGVRERGSEGEMESEDRKEGGREQVTG
eukprot:3229349-Rhodomonas_salina.1